MTKARKAYYSTSPMPLLSKQFKHMSRFANTQISKPDISEIPYFFNPKLPDDINNELNGVWKTHIADEKTKFRKNMGALATKLAEQIAKLSRLQRLVLSSLNR